MDKIVSKLNRVEGQVRGVRKMVEEGKSCIEVVQQLMAARSALAGVAKDLLASEACGMAGKKKGQEDFDRVIKSLLEISN